MLKKQQKTLLQGVEFLTTIWPLGCDYKKIGSAQHSCSFLIKNLTKKEEIWRKITKEKKRNFLFLFFFFLFLLQLPPWIFLLFFFLLLNPTFSLKKCSKQKRRKLENLDVYESVQGVRKLFHVSQPSSSKMLELHIVIESLSLESKPIYFRTKQNKLETLLLIPYSHPTYLRWNPLRWKLGFFPN